MSATGNGSLSLAPKQRPGGAPFPVGSADQGLTVDPTSGAIVFGQEEGTTPASPFLTNREVHTNNKLVRYRDVSAFVWHDTSLTRQIGIGFGVEPVFSLDGDAGALIAFRTQQPTLNGLSEISRNILWDGLQIRNNNQVNLATNIGIQIFDTQQLQIVDRPGVNRFMDIHPQIGSFQFGDLDGKFNNTFIDVNDNGQDITFVSANGIRTLDPGSGQGSWKLGTVVAAASVLDATRYVEVAIGGTIVKLGIIV